MNTYRILKKILTQLCAVLALSVAMSAHAIPFANGDFSSGSGWNDFSGNGSTSIAGGQAQLETGAGADPFSAILVQGDDGSFGFLSPITLASNVTTLTFDASFINLGSDIDESGIFSFTDELFVNLYDAIDFSFDLLSLPGINSTAALGFVSYSIDVSSLAGRDVALSFELLDEDDGFDSRVLLDNVVFNTASVSVPEPSTLYLLSLGVLLSINSVRGRKKRV